MKPIQKKTNKNVGIIPVSEDSQKKRITPAYILAGILLLTFIVFYKSINNDFVLNWDDQNYILNNPFIQNLSWESIKNIFSNSWKGNYVPITNLLYAIQLKFFGTSPGSFHTISIFIHLINISLVYFLAKKFIKNGHTITLITLLFALNPLQVESVAWIGEQKNLLYSMFFLMGTLTYLGYLQNETKINYLILTFILFILSCLSKPTGVTLVPILFLLDYYFKHPLSLKNILLKVPFLALAVVIGLVAISAHDKIKAIDSISSSFSIFEICLLFFYQIQFYIVKMIIPIGLSAMYYFPAPNAGLNWSYYIAPVTILIIVWIIFKTKRHKKELIFGTLFFLFSISVMIRIKAFGGAFMADRYLYIPYFGFLFILGVFYSNVIEGNYLFSKKIKFPLQITMICYLIFFTINTFNQIDIWKNGVTLFTDIIKNDPDRAMGYHYRGIAKALTFQDNNGCIEDQNEALMINPKYAEAYYARGLAKYSIKDNKSAFLDFEKAVSFKPDYPDAYNNMGSIMLLYKQYPKALDFINLALKYDNKHNSALFNKGLYFYYLKDFKQACIYWNESAFSGNKKAAQYIQKYCR